MKHLQGKKIKVKLTNGNCLLGIVTGATEEILKILSQNETDQQVIFIRNIFSYVVIGQGVTGGYSGLQVFACKNLNIGCKGRLKLSLNKNLKIQEMGCGACDKGFKCDFGTLGQMQLLPSNVQKVLFDGLLKDNNKKE